MSNEMNDRIDDLLTLAALGELTDAEQIELDAALAADAALGDELAADLATAARLQSSTRVTPPDSSKGIIMDAIAGVEQDPAPTPPVHQAAPSPSNVALPVINIGRARRRRWQPLAVAAAVAMLLVGGVIVGTRDSGPSQFDVVAQSSDAQRRTLDGELGGTLNVVWSPSADAFALEGTDIPTLTESETYQLWFVDDEGATPVGLFRPDSAGVVEQIFDDLDPSDFLVGVTVEPAGGSDSPTLPIVAAA